MLEPSGFITTLSTDENDDIILDFPTELLEALGWAEGDKLDIQAFAGRIIISKVTGTRSKGGNSVDL